MIAARDREPDYALQLPSQMLRLPDYLSGAFGKFSWQAVVLKGMFSCPKCARIVSGPKLSPRRVEALTCRDRL
jgi:hypothetical protein